MIGGMCPCAPSENCPQTARHLPFRFIGFAGQLGKKPHIITTVHVTMDTHALMIVSSGVHTLVGDTCISSNPPYKAGSHFSLESFHV